MGMLALPGNNNKASNASILNMTPSEAKLKEQLASLNSHGIRNPQDAVKFMLDVIQSDKQTVSAEFQSLREDNLDGPISAIETAAGIYNRDSVRDREERKTDFKAAMNMLEPAVRTLLRRTQRYVGKVIEIDQTPKAKRLMSAFHQLSAQVDSYSFCARICFESAVAGMTYARAIDVELGGGYTKSLIQTFNECIDSLTDRNRRCLIMSEYAASEDLEAFWLEVPEASTRMINSGDWDSLAQIAEKSAHMRIAPTPTPAQVAEKNADTQIAPAQIVVNSAKPGPFSGFIQRLIFLFTGKPFEEQTLQIPANASPSNPSKPSDSPIDEPEDESESEQPDYEHIVF